MSAAGVFVIGVLALCGCAATGSVSSPSDTRGDASVQSDSMAAIEDVLSEVSSEELPAPVPSEVPRTSKAAVMVRRVDVSVITGARSQTRCLAQAGPITVGYREDGVSRRWYAGYTRRGFVRQILVGNQKVQVGERIAFGRGFGSFPTSSLRPVSVGFRSTPSLSRWFGGPAVSVVMAAGRLTAHTVMTLVPERPWQNGPSWALASLVGTGGGFTMGVTVASDVQRDAPDPFATRPTLRSALVSLHGDWRDSDARVSFECVRFGDGRLFGAVRAIRRSPARWSLLLFRVPVFSSGSLPGWTGRPTMNERIGCLLEARRRVGWFTGNGSFETVVLRRAFSDRLTHRFHAACILRTRTHVWQLTARVRRDHETTWPAGVLPGDARVTNEWTARLRSVLRIRNGLWSHLMLVEYFPGRFRRTDGVLLTLASTAMSGRVELSWRMSAYDIPAGRVGFISRPGIGTFEFFSSVYGRGSDVSVRARLAVSKAIRLEIYVGAPWQKHARAYAGLRIRL
ncbi:MAG: hypothetical protein O7D32_11470 [bacterium]|nr:hypothetical protein [bacterium]